MHLSIQNLAVISVLIPPTFGLPAGHAQRPPVSLSTLESDAVSAMRSFSITQVSNPNFSSRSGPAAYKSAIAKYTTPSSTTSNSGKKVEINSSEANSNAIDNTDLEYLTPVTVDGNQYLLNFDTGSSNLWIGGQQTSAKDKFVPTNQPVDDNSWSIAYGDGSSASGQVYMETVVVGDTTATQVPVGLATAAPSSIFAVGDNGQPGADGLLGLGFSSANTFNPPQKTWLDTAVAQGLPNVFGVNLQPGSAPGSFDFGEINSASYTGAITYVPVVTSQPGTTQYWMVSPTKGDMGVMDTGTTLMLLSPSTTQAYFTSPAAVAAGAQYVQSGSYWAYNCNSTLPDFSIQFGNHTAVVPGNFLDYEVLGNGLCYAGIQERAASMDFSIYGDRFLMTQYVVFDQRSGSPQLGFANKA